MPAKRRKRITPAIIFTMGVIAFGLALAALTGHWQAAFDDPDRHKLAFERNTRLAWHRAGLRLIGTPDLGDLNNRLTNAGVSLGVPIFMRIFKREFELEIWVKQGDVFRHFATYPICRYSGTLGPKQKRGDRQAPEGVYTVASNQLNTKSRWHRSFNLGYPNRFDRAHRRTGDYLMVHGGCSSIGCYAMTNEVIDEIWALVTAALKHGQPRFQVQIFPFRMTESALQQRSDHRWAPFWRELKPAYDIFQTTRVPPRVAVCDGHYNFTPAGKTTTGSAKIANRCTKTTAKKGTAVLRKIE